MTTDYDFIFTAEPAQPVSASPLLQRLILGAIALLIALTAFFVGMMYERRTSTAAATDLNTFWQVWEILEDDFYGELPSNDLRKYGAINGLISSLNDPFTTFAPPEVATVRREQLDGHFGGVGIVVRANDQGQVFVLQIIPGNPAAAAGIEAGDIFVEVDGQAILGYTTDQVAALVRGEVGTDVMLKMYRPETDETYEVSVRRAIIETPTVYSENLEGIGYVNLTTFNGVATSQMEDHLQALLDADVKGLILDLRGNGGGLLDQAVQISDLFLAEGVVVTQRSSKGAEDVFRSDNGDLAEDIPLVVLVDGNSASASEVVAGALQDRDRAILIGQDTFGKGVVQYVYNLSDGSQLRVTSSAWYTPKDKAIHMEGLHPDLPVAESFSPAGDDLMIEAALKYLQEVGLDE